MLVAYGAHYSLNQDSHVRDEVLGYLGNCLECMARFRCGNGEASIVNRGDFGCWHIPTQEKPRAGSLRMCIIYECI
jgi:hypothetical protein